MGSSSDFLYYVPIFSDLPEETIEQISQVGIKKTFKKDNIILMEEDESGALFIIVTGKVKITRSIARIRISIIITCIANYFGSR